ncbi:MAG TPA: TetR/AcrR family transcriptional regulator [Alphaproteobacteria bacterium]|nr:TetR/AcrR family transcriptional regulator [Alphaproteobacteria bacterium]
MGRKLEFCREKALHTAMESFWAQGYEHTSMRDLAAKLGLHLGSVYNALGDKERVFESALKLHFDEYVRPEMERLTTAENPLGAMESLLTQVADECGAAEGPRCFIINSLLEITSINDSISALLKEYMQMMETTFTQCLMRAQKLGQIPAHAEPAALAHFFMGTLFSLRTMGKLKTPAAHLKDIQACTMRALRA